MIPNNVLILGAPKSGKLRAVQSLVGDTDFASVLDETHSGLIFSTDLATKYFTSQVKLLVDEYPENRSDTLDDFAKLLEQWHSEFSHDDMAELRSAIDGVIFTVNMKRASQIVRELDVILQIKDSLQDQEPFVVVLGSSDGAVDQAQVTDLEDRVIERGIEFINLEDSGKNEFGDKIGKDRLREVLETHDWSNMEVSSSGKKKYETNQSEKIAGMGQSLLDEKSEPLDLEVLVGRLQAERQKVTKLSDKEKREHIEALVDEYMTYF